MNDKFLQNLTSVILHKTGIKVRPEDSPRLLQQITKRMQVLRLKNEFEYLQLLSSASREAKLEWDRLFSLITTGESYFFRDQGQIKTIQEYILPDLINKMQDQRTLNILSAGCATGEEVYSLAIIIRENFPELTNWQVNLVGIDLNKEAISKALQGIYPAWSFRGVRPQYRSIYFRQQEAGWQIIDSLKQKVKFRQCNLVEDHLSFFAVGTVDLIICRNVFIYFDKGKISLVLCKFIELLRPGGYLLTGHTELQEQDIAPLIVHSYPESLVYQKPENGSMPVSTLNLPAPSLENLKERARENFTQGRYRETIEYLTDWLNFQPQDEEAELLLAKTYMNQGQYEKAEEICYGVLERNHLAVLFLQILAQINRARGRKDEAKECLRRAVLVDPNFIPGYLDLIDLHLADQEYSSAEKLLSFVKSLDTEVITLYQTQIYSTENLIKINQNSHQS
ncbi:CheR family methyltransferase [Gloeomargarita sp.]